MYPEIIVGCFIAVFMIILIHAEIKDIKACCTICGYQPNQGYYWISNKRYCESCFKTIRECKLTEQEIQYSILMHIQERRKNIIDKTKLIEEDKWHWLKKDRK